jgi:Tripartite tricarboxylate transporter TctB family
LRARGEVIDQGLLTDDTRMALEAERQPGGSGARTWNTGRSAAVPLTFLCISLWICLEALQVPFGSFRMPGAGFFPLLLGVTLGILAVALLGMSLYDSAERAVAVGPTRPEILYLIGAMYASVWLFERAGYLLTMAIFLGVVLKALGKTGWTVAVVVALIGSIASYLLFGHILMIALPAGILPF